MNSEELRRLRGVCRQEGFSTVFADELEDELDPAGRGARVIARGTQAPLPSGHMRVIIVHPKSQDPVLFSASKINMVALIALIVAGQTPPTSLGAIVSLLTAIGAAVSSMRVSLTTREVALIRELLNYSHPTDAMTLIHTVNKHLFSGDAIHGDGQQVVDGLRKKGARIDIAGMGNQATIQLKEFVVDFP